MAQNFFLKMDGVEGECPVEGHRQDIHVLSWNHSFNQPTSPNRSSAGGGVVEQANHADFSVTKYMDVASVPLMKLCWNGRTVPSAVFIACRSEGGALEEYLKVEMTDVIVSNISVGGGTGDLSTETVTLSYGAVRYTHRPDPAKSGEAKVKTARHDLRQMKVE